jgi:D-arginine dehydrogenase
VRRKWAGLRSFVADRTPVAGFAPEAPGFFWLAGQGGYGIQTAPAMGELAGALVRGLPIPPAIAAFGVRAEDLSPARAALRSPAAGASRPEPAGHES